MGDKLFNSQQVDLMASVFQRRDESQFAWRDIEAMFKIPLGCRGLWPMSLVDEIGDQKDASSQGSDLTYNGSGVYGYDGLIPYIDLDSRTPDYLERADEAALRITGAETYIDTPFQGIFLCSWVWFTGAASAQNYIISKKSGAAAANTSYSLSRTAGGLAQFEFSNGLAIDSVNSTVVLAAQTWYFVAGVFDVNNGTKSVWVDGVEVQQATLLGAINNSTANLQIGGRDNGAGGSTGNMTGKVSLSALYAAAPHDSIPWLLYQLSRRMFDPLP